MTTERRLLLETLAGHFSWLERTHPEKAATAIAQRARRCVQNTLRRCRAFEEEASAVTERMIAQRLGLEEPWCCAED